MSALSRNVDEFVKELKAMPAKLQERPLFTAINAKVPRTLRCPLLAATHLLGQITSLADSVPLLSALKNEAIRERHWKDIMKRTGVNFVGDVKSITLGSLFAAQLHRYAEFIQQIAATAMQEAKIEKDLNRVATQWNQTNLPLSVYMGDEKRGEARVTTRVVADVCVCVCVCACVRAHGAGHILQDCSTIIQDLEDHALQLQAMSNSPYAVAFSQDIRTWEKRVSHVSETIAVWLIVQKYVELRPCVHQHAVTSRAPEQEVDVPRGHLHRLGGHSHAAARSSQEGAPRVCVRAFCADSDPWRAV